MTTKREIKDGASHILASRPQQLRSYIWPPLPSSVSFTLGPILANDASTDRPMWSRSIHCFAVHPSSLVHSLALKGNTWVLTIGRHLPLPASLPPYLWLVTLKKSCRTFYGIVFGALLLAPHSNPQIIPQKCVPPTRTIRHARFQVQLARAWLAGSNLGPSD